MTQDGGYPPRTSRPDLPLDAEAESVLRARNDLLTQRDHVIGLEAESANLQRMVDRMTLRQMAQRERIEILRDKLERQRRRADRLQIELDALKISESSKPARRLLPRRDAG